jgi:hypothetical protein
MGEDRLRPEVIPNVCCPAARSIGKALKDACAVLSMEFKIPEYIDRIPKGTRRTCVSLRTSMEEWMSECLKRRSVHWRRKRRLSLAFKSFKRLFDVSCRECDPLLSTEAKRKWEAHVGKDVPMSSLPSGGDLEELRQAVRENLSGWGRMLASARVESELPFLGEYVPDQQGCYEISRGDGGTLACAVSDYSGDWGAVRLGVAKTKGKFRVVTMQSAEVKRILAPVHNALYNHCTSYGWCVRGDVTGGDFRAIVRDRREGESFISGDYVAATDNIYLPAVQIIVDEIARSSELSEEERSVLVGSFTDLRYKKAIVLDDHYAIKRGSMMGNLVSFPLLCLLNKSCWDIACNIRGGDRRRIGRFNGDDCMFAGDRQFFGTWRGVTARYGLVVNEEKTEFSGRCLDLNSQTYDVHKSSMIAKATLGFLRPARSEPSDMLSEVVRGLVGFSRVHVLDVILKLRWEISLRGVMGSLGCLSPWLRKQLVRMRWFRSAALMGGCPIDEKGVDRAVPVSVARPPRARFLPLVSSAAARLQRDHTEEWMGKRVTPLSRKLVRPSRQWQRKALSSVSSRRRFEWIGLRWAFVWPTALLEVAKQYPSVFARHDTKWFDDHPFLTTRPHVVEVRKVYSIGVGPPCALLQGVCVGKWRPTVL